MRMEKEQSSLPDFRDIFLSHRSLDDEFVWKLAGDIERETYQGRQLLSWVDEAEIGTGSVVEIINHGLEMSRFLAIIMTPDYFQSESGWTDAEWHAAISTDPDNRKGRVLPLLIKDCPYVPYLLRHLRIIDMRDKRYKKGLSELLMILKGERLPRPTTYRGQLITPSGLITRETLYVERSVPEADPDITPENLHCNLIPAERLPQRIYTAPISNEILKTRRDGTKKVPSKAVIKDEIRIAQEKTGVERPSVPAFRLLENKIVTFHDLEDPDGPFDTIIEDQSVEEHRTDDWVIKEDDRRIVISLLNMAVNRHLIRNGLVSDQERPGRFFFPPKDGGKNVVEWMPFKRRIKREVAGPRFDEEGKVTFWKHLSAYIKLVFIGKGFYLQIKPTYVFTEDGSIIKRGPSLTRLINRWTNPERNIHVMYHIRFWTSILRRKRGPISILAGDQFIEFPNRPAFIKLPYGISDDQKDLMRYLEDEIPFLDRTENELIELAAGEMEIEEGTIIDGEEEQEEESLMDKEDLEG